MNAACQFLPRDTIVTENTLSRMPICRALAAVKQDIDGSNRALAARQFEKTRGAFSSGLISRAAALAIRLAVIFCHARKDVELPIMTIHRSNEQLVVRLAEVWLNAHPLTDYLLKEESDCWDRVGRSVKIEKF